MHHRYQIQSISVELDDKTHTELAGHAYISDRDARSGPQFHDPKRKIQTEKLRSIMDFQT